MASDEILDPEERIKELEAKVEALIADRAKLAAAHKALTAEHKLLQQANEALLARQAELEAELEGLQAERPALSLNQLGAQLKEALTAVQAAPPPEGTKLEYAVRNAQFEIKAIVDFDGDGQPVLKFPKAGERLDPNKLTTVNLAFDSLPRPEVDLAALKLVPTLLGLTQEGAATRLQRAGLQLGGVEEQESQATPGVVVAQDPEGGSYVAEDTPVDIKLAVPAKVAVPDVVGEPLIVARRRLEEAQLRVGEVSGEESGETAGTVLAQNPKAGTRVDARSAVDLVVAERPPRIRMPNLVGLKLAAARKILRESGLKEGVVREQRSDQPAGTVLQQRPRAKIQVEVGTSVDLVIARTVIERTVPTPELVGMKRAEAITKLHEDDWAFRLAAAQADDVAAERAAGRFDTVFAQSPEPGEPVLTTEKVVRLTVLASPDPVQTVPGIGPRLSSRLAAAGISTVGDLALADPEDVMKAADISHARANEFQAEASDLNAAFHLEAVDGVARAVALMLVKAGNVRTPDELSRKRAATLLKQLRSAPRQELPPIVGRLRLTQRLVASWIEAARDFVRRH